MSGPRNSGGEILALAKTDTGVTSVFWEPLSKTWVLSDNSVGDVLAAAPAPATLLLEEEVDTSNMNSKYMSYINNLKNESNASYYKIWIKDFISSTIYFSLLLYTLLNTAAIFFFNEILTSLIIYFILFTAIHFWNKHYK